MQGSPGAHAVRTHFLASRPVSQLMSKTASVLDGLFRTRMDKHISGEAQEARSQNGSGREHGSEGEVASGLSTGSCTRACSCSHCSSCWDCERCAHRAEHHHHHHCAASESEVTARRVLLDLVKPLWAHDRRGKHAKHWIHAPAMRTRSSPVGARRGLYGQDRVK